MTTREHFHLTMRERRRVCRNTPEHQYLTRVARKFVWIMRGVPTTEWPTT